MSTGPGPYPPAPGLAPGPHQHQGPPPRAQPAAGPWAERAGRRSGFGRLVLVEFRKLVGTRSDKIVLAAAPVLLVGVIALFTLNQRGLAGTGSQIQPVLVCIQLGQLLMYAAVIKLVAGEWQYKSVQPTLLVQPSRLRYVLAQFVVVVAVWLVATVITAVSYLLLLGPRQRELHFQYFLELRPGWFLGVVAVGTAMVLVTALTIAMRIPNTAGALTVYFLAVPGLTVAYLAAPEVVGWFYPLEPAYQLAGLGQGIGPALVSIAVWCVGLLGEALFRLVRRDAG